MKKITLALVAFMLVLGMTQCKKEQQPNNASVEEGETVYISMKVVDNGGKHIVYPGTGAVVYSDGDVIYVGNNGHYVGTLTYANGTFSGSIKNPSTSDYLHFYFIGGCTPSVTPSAGSTTSFSVSITDQKSKLPVISYGHSTTKYIDGTTAYTCMLENKCALVKFNVTTVSTLATCITGFNNRVTMDFSTNTFTNSQENNGVITLAAGSGEKWAILLPQEALGIGMEGSSYSEDGEYIGTRDAISAISENDYLTMGIEVTVDRFFITGAICGKFTINENGDQVYFSQGNLQYIGSAATPYWKFADNQWDYVGSHILGVPTGQQSTAQNVNRDLFGWGTSGWNNGNMYYQPYDTSTDNGSYGPTDGTNYNYDLTGDYANADWGVYNAINNGGNTPNQWRTLTYSEWSYVIYDRSTPSGILYAKGNVNGVNGFILLPDDWSASVYALNSTNNSSADFTSNEITAESWATMESAGAVFLPAAGLRQSTMVGNVNSGGYYWSSSLHPSYPSEAGLFYFESGNTHMGSNFRRYGFSVRLVCEH